MRESSDKTRHRVNRWRIERLFNRVVTSSKSSLWDEVVLIQISRSRALPVRTSRSPAIVTPDSAHLSTSREDTFGRFASSCVSVEYTIRRILCPNRGGKVNLLHELFPIARVHVFRHCMHDICGAGSLLSSMIFQESIEFVI